MTMLIDKIRERAKARQPSSNAEPVYGEHAIPQCLRDFSFTSIPQTQWNTAMVLVTPELAEKMLESNTSNRNLRKQTVGKYSATMKAGNWTTSPESISFDTNGVVLNGQHRLHAVVNSGVSQNFLIVTNVSPDVFAVLDRNAVRSPADVLQIPRKLAETARAMVTIIDSAGVIDQDIKLVADIITDEHDRLMTQGSASTRKIVSSAPVRAAACVRLLEGNDPKYIIRTYRNMVLQRYHELPPVAGVFMQQVNNSKMGLSSNGRKNQRDLICRAMDVFNPSSASKTRIQVNAIEPRIDEIRKIIEAAYVS